MLGKGSCPRSTEIKEKNMEWTFKDGLPIYTQLIEQIKMRIAGGAFQPGEKVPAVREMAIDAGVNPNTMQRALSELERDGLVYSVRTSGRFITEEKETLDNLQKSLSKNFIEQLFENLEKLGMNREEIVNAVNQWVEEAE